MCVNILNYREIFYTLTLKLSARGGNRQGQSQDF